MILPEDFVNEMEAHWTGQLGNVSSPALRKVWKQLAETFGGHIAGHSSPTEARRWYVLQPPTGSGKSQGTVVYCGMLSSHMAPELHPGALIVTRLIDDADQMVSQINEMTGKDVAVAYHSENKVQLDNLKGFPVLVITHRAYELALDKLGKGATIKNTWPAFHSWGDESQKERQLVVIDEALDIVEHSQAGLQGLKDTYQMIPENLRAEYPVQVNALDYIIKVMSLIEGRGKKGEAERMISDGAARERQLAELVAAQGKDVVISPPDMMPLRDALSEVQFERKAGARQENLELRREMFKTHDDRLRSLHHIFRTWSYYASHVDEGRHALNTARLLVPEDTKGAVVLDATAGSNVLYEVFDEATVLASPPNSRSYRNVVVHVSRGHKVGKRWMFNNAKRLAGELMSNLNETIRPDQRVFIVTHKAVEPYLQGFNTDFEVSTGHWGAIDGSNQWRDCDVVVVFGLPYMPGTWAPNVFMATQGPQSTEWLQEATERAFGEHQDVRKALSDGQMTVSVVQALNRIRMRKTIDDKGNCPVSDVYLMLPNAGAGDILLDGIRAEMPGVQIVDDWSVEVSKRKVRCSNHEVKLAKWIETVEGTGRWAAVKLRNQLGIPASTWKKLMVKLRDQSTDLYQSMTENGFRYVVKGSGRSQKAEMVRHG